MNWAHKILTQIIYTRSEELQITYRWFSNVSKVYLILDPPMQDLI